MAYRPFESDAILVKIVTVLSVLALLFVCFQYLGDFSSQQSIMLTFLVFGFGFGIRTVAKEMRASSRSENAFKPFRVSVHPKWHELLADLTIISMVPKDGNKEVIGGREYVIGVGKARENVWFAVVRELKERFVALESVPYSVFLNGFNFTVIRPPSSSVYSSLPGLTYCNDRKIFLAALELSERIALPGGWSEDRSFKHEWWGTAPEFFFRAGDNGYELGLEVERDWWENLRKTGEIGELAKIKSPKELKTSYRNNRLRLVTATLPYSAFSSYYEELDYDQRHKQSEVSEKEIAAHGWKHKLDNSGFERPVPRGLREIEHKYFTVEHWSV
jgi:hypothetical protein